MPKKMRSDFNHYLTLKGVKAYAMALDFNQKWAYGYGYGYENQKLANKRAMQECINNTLAYKVEADCIIAYEGNTKK